MLHESTLMLKHGNVMQFFERRCRGRPIHVFVILQNLAEDTGVPFSEPRAVFKAV